jgi:hypothetical protein
MDGGAVSHGYLLVRVEVLRLIQAAGPGVATGAQNSTIAV